MSNNALAQLVADSKWLAFCKAMESGDASIDHVKAHGLLWRFARRSADDEVVYTFRVTREDSSR